MSAASLTVDEALLWLNDRLRSDVHLDVTVEAVGEFSEPVLSCSGVLVHSTTIPGQTTPPTPEGRDELASTYYVGSTAFAIPDSARVTVKGDELTIALTDEVSFIVQADDEGSA